MGHGIAQVAAAAGYRVILRDLDRESLAKGIRAIERNLDKGMRLGKLTEEDREQTLQNIRGTTHLDQVATADLIIEAAPEQLELKQELLRETESFSDHNFIFASNTSSLSISEIASVSSRPSRVVGMHFFNPVHVMRLLEIVVGKATDRRHCGNCPRGWPPDAQGTDHRERCARFCFESSRRRPWA